MISPATRERQPNKAVRLALEETFEDLQQRGIVAIRELRNRDAGFVRRMCRHGRVAGAGNCRGKFEAQASMHRVIMTTNTSARMITPSM
jgi:hypothetical protein